MMNKIFAMSLLLAGGLLATSCVSEEDDLFDKTAAERLNEIKDIYSARLEAQPAGWAMQYYPTDEDAVPFGNGYLILCDFNPDHSVRVAMRNAFTNDKYDEATSVWDVITDNGPVLSFSSYNRLFHIFSSPEDVPSTDDNETGTGIGGDYEFVIVDAPEDASYMMLKGKKRGIYSLLTPLEEGTDYEQYFKDVNTFTNTMFSATVPNRIYMFNNGKKYGFDEASTTIPLVYVDGTDPITTGVHYHFIITKRYDDYYLRFRETIFVEESGAKVQDFRYDPESDRFVSTENSEVYITGEDPATFFHGEIIDEHHRWQWQNSSEMSDKFKEKWTAANQAFKNVGGSLTNLAFRQDGGQPRIRVTYNLGGSSYEDYLYSMQKDDSGIALQYQGPSKSSGQTALDNLPALKDLIEMMGQHLTISAATTTFNLRYVKVTFSNDPDMWFVARWY